jgi:hypothetical protein
LHPFAATANSGSPASAGTTAPASGITSSPFSPGTLWALISAQGQQPGSNATSPTATAGSATGQVAGASDPTVAATPDGDDDAADQDPLTSTHSSHGHHHHMHGGGAQGSGNGSSEGNSLLDVLTSGSQGATSQSTNNPNGSTSTTINYADGSTVTLTTLASSTGSSGSAPSSSGASSVGSTSSTSSNQTSAILMERLIQMQAQLLGASNVSTVAIA